MQHVWRMLWRLLENSLFVKAEKCEFHSSSVSSLGYIIAQNSIQKDPAKVSAIVDWPLPESRKHLQRLLVFVNFYR